jgi:hypothetical protein
MAPTDIASQDENYLGCHRSVGDGMGWCRRPPWSAENVMWVVKQRQK